MLDEKDLQAIAQLMDKKLALISAQLDTMESKVDKMQFDIDQLKEQSEITRVALDRIIDWSDRVSNMAGYPLP